MKKEQSGQGNNIPGFQRLHVWQKAKDLALNIYAMSTTGAFATDFSLRDQIRRAAVSVPSNIAEGYGRNSTSDYVRFLQMACGSLYELQTQLEIAVNRKYLDSETVQPLISAADEIGRMLGGLIASLDTSNQRQTAFKGVAQ